MKPSLRDAEGSGRQRHWLKRSLLLLVLAGAAGWLWCSTRDYGAGFLNRKGTLAGFSESGPRQVTLASDRGWNVEARVHVPAAPRKVPGVLLAAGLETGMRVIDLVEPRDDLVMLAVDYGWEGDFDVQSLPATVRSLRRLHRVAGEAVPRLLLGLDYLAQLPEVDTNRLAVVGVSFGSYFALPAAALDARVERVILAQGGGEIGAVVAASAPFWQASLPPWALAGIASGIFRPFQPERWVARVAPRRLTFIASRTDPQFPVEAVERVFARAGKPKELIWHDTPHVAPDAAAIIAELSRVVLEQLGTEPAR